jgi:hypothetical protein
MVPQVGQGVRVSELAFVDKLPKTRSGKIMRRLLKATEPGLEPGDMTTLEDRVAPARTGAAARQERSRCQTLSCAF